VPVDLDLHDRRAVDHRESSGTDGGAVGMPVTMEEFERGVAVWGTTRWPTDFHNAFYADLAEANPRGRFTEAWWQWLRPHVVAWKAYRPEPVAVLAERARERFERLDDKWLECCAPVSDREVAQVDWRQVAAFAAVVNELKPGSAVFTGKVCHFLLPAVFPLVDNWGMGLPFGRTYAAHFKGVRREVETTPDGVLQEATEALASRIQAPLTPGYPLTNKAIELCLIGRHKGP
jgi:hypothetical protein